MKDPKQPREFTDFSDNPTNNGFIGQEKDWDEINLKHGFDEREEGIVVDMFDEDDLWDDYDENTERFD